VLIFTRTKYRAERLAQQLQQSGHHVAAFQGNMSQTERQAAMDNFRDGRVKILVATDIAARGIDVLSISHVINYDMPDCTDAYTHRIGRTGRIGQNGEAFSLVTPEDSTLVGDIERLLNTRIERQTVSGFDYSSSKNEGATKKSPYRSNRRQSPQQVLSATR
jgi:ATP-dependent RNA helicase RhlE